jgi:aspartate kinase
MRVFKFGGASIKDAESVRNVGNIIKSTLDKNLVVVISAMGKITNLLEALVDAYYYKTGNTEGILMRLKKFHFNIIEQLFSDEQHLVYHEMNRLFTELRQLLNTESKQNYPYVYDQFVCFGELLSTKIVSFYLAGAGINNKWEDARNFIKTDTAYTEGKVDWRLTESLIQNRFKENGNLIVTQGFIAGTSENSTSTLGREGSDYSAAIIAHCLNAESVTIWKDVSGMLNADPKWFEDTKLIEQLSYQDAVELSYFGATVIHPKTIKPLQNKNIPLYVRSFMKPLEKGTVINALPVTLPIPCFIFKMDQVLISISSKDFSFIVEENLSDIFKMFAEQGIKINTMQNSAISFSVCVDYNERKIDPLIHKLKEHYRVLYNKDIELVTIRHYDQGTISRIIKNKKVILEVKSRNTVQFVLQ